MRETVSTLLEIVGMFAVAAGVVWAFGPPGALLLLGVVLASVGYGMAK